jgi:putative membrane protein
MGSRLLILLVKLVINALALVVVDAMFDGVKIDDWQTMVAAAVTLALVNTYLKPVVVVLTLPINIVTLGLFTLVINGLLLWLVHWLLRDTFHIAGFWTAVWAALVMSIVSILLSWFLRPPRTA